MKKAVLLFVCTGMILFTGCGSIPIVSVFDTPDAARLMTGGGSEPISGRAMVSYVDTGFFAELFGLMKEDTENTFVPVYDVVNETGEYFQLYNRDGSF
mgnify:CR=1 FL=1